MLQIILLISLLSLILSAYTLIRLLPKKVRNSKSVLLDTSALIDGRILEVVKSGFVPDQLLIPRFVIAELQLLADKADHLKRERARYGLQVIQDLQNSRFANVSIISDDIKDESGVDEKLVKLGIKINALLFTTDYNLLKVAEIEGLRVLNINELAQNLRLTHIPGELIEVKIVSKGQEKTQGVGYLEDGTMVVIEKASSLQGKQVKAEVTRSLQTAAGRMMFAKLLARPSKPKSPEPKPKAGRSSQRSHRKATIEDQLLATIESNQ